MKLPSNNTIPCSSLWFEELFRKHVFFEYSDRGSQVMNGSCKEEAYKFDFCHKELGISVIETNKFVLRLVSPYGPI